MFLYVNEVRMLKKTEHLNLNKLKYELFFITLRIRGIEIIANVTYSTWTQGNLKIWCVSTK